MKEDYTTWFKKWSEEIEKKHCILKASWKGSFGDWKENCPELKQRLICTKCINEPMVEQ